MLWLRFRTHWRQRWGSLLALTVLVAIVGSVVLTTLAGARRTESVVERVDEHYQVPDTFALFEDQSTFEQTDAILDSPLVEKGDRIEVIAAFSELGYLPLIASVDGRFGVDMHFNRLVQGRRPAADAPLEVALPEWAVAATGRGIGDTIPFSSVSKEQGRCLFESGLEASTDPVCDAITAIFDGEPDFSAFAGPAFDLEVVGIVQELDQDDPNAVNSEPIYLSEAFHREYGHLIATSPGLVARFRPGVTDGEFERELSKFVGPEKLEDFTYSSTTFDSLDATASTIASGLLIFAGVAAIAGLVAIAQAVVRQSAAAAADGRVIAALGATRATRAFDPLVPLVPVAVGGALLAVATAWLASPIMPVGSPRDIETSRGFDFDGFVLVAGGAALALFVLAGGWIAAAWIGRTCRRGSPSRAGAGLPATVPA
ncbi:MAG TPA: hypothetical protein VFX21_15830, partial [Acidimicrobiia bacterium]|nr:hypothetical protein [Acidimicrobiia bacterium]